MALQRIATALVLCGCVAAQDTSTDNSTNSTALDIDVFTQGSSGKFTLRRASLANDPNAMTITMDALTEVDAAGNAVGTSGAEKHSVQTFASQVFTIGTTDNVPVGDGNITAKMVAFNATIGNIGVLGIDTYIIKTGGVAGPTGAEWTFRPGDLKWNIRFDSWTFCGYGASCGTGNTVQMGEFVEVDIEVKGKSSAQALSGTTGMSKNTDDAYSLGGGINIFLTKTVMIDGNTTEMPAGYPKVVMKGAKQIFTFRFPRFNSSAVYDPAVSSSQSESLSPVPDASGGVSLSTGFWSLFAAPLMAVLGRSSKY